MHASRNDLHTTLTEWRTGRACNYRRMWCPVEIDIMKETSVGSSNVTVMAVNKNKGLLFFTHPEDFEVSDHTCHRSPFPLHFLEKAHSLFSHVSSKNPTHPLLLPFLLPSIIFKLLGTNRSAC